MSNVPDQSPSITIGRLTKSSYQNVQDFANELVRAMSVVFPPGFLQRKGEKGDQGTTVKMSSQQFPVAQGASTVNVGFDTTQCICNLSTTAASPTIGILCHKGALVVLTSPTPDASYTLFVTKLEKGA